MQKNYSVKMSGCKELKLMLNSEAQEFGGNDTRDIDVIKTGRGGRISLNLMPYSAVMYVIK